MHSLTEDLLCVFTYVHVSPVLTIVLLSVPLLLYRIYLSLLPKPIPGMPHNPEAVRSILGDAPSMLRETRETGETVAWMRKQSEKLNAPLCQVFMQPFSYPFLILADWREAQDVLTKRKEFDRSSWTKNLMSPIPDHHIRMSTGSEWKDARKLTQDLMIPAFLNNIAGPAIYAKVLDFVRLWEIKTELAGGRPFSAQIDMYHTVLDAVMAFTFGAGFQHAAVRPQSELLEGLDPGQKSALLKSGRPGDPVEFPTAALHESLDFCMAAGHVLEKLITSPSPKLTYWWECQKPAFKKILGAKDRFVKEGIDKAVAKARAHGDSEEWVSSAVDHMILREKTLAEKSGREPEYWDGRMRDEIIFNVIGGHELMANTVVWGLKFLTDSPAAQASLRAALRSAHAGAAAERRRPSLEEIARAAVPYLDGAMEEMLRLSAMPVSREATCDTELLGYRIPRGTNVLMLSSGPGFLSPPLAVAEGRRSPSSRATRARQWDPSGDMGAFDPARWLVRDGDGDGEPRFDAAAGPQLAFGLGIRGCAGRRLVYTGMRILVTLMVWDFELLPVPAELSGYAARDGVAHTPRQCFVRLRKLDH